MDSHQYYRKIVRVTEEFLGPAAERFVNRQIEFRLGKTPETLTRGDLPKLKETLVVALGLLAKDQAITDEATHKYDAVIKE
jgi:hypothetical protein